jgi:hypothetical protein
MVVSEPDPGRVLAERELDGSTATTFTLEPIAGNQTRVTIATTMATRSGFAGMMERLMTPPVMRRIYKQELELIATYMTGDAQ